MNTDNSYVGRLFAILVIKLSITQRFADASGKKKTREPIRRP